MRRLSDEGGGAAGVWAEVEINQWWCDEHKHLAEPDDFEPYEPPYVGLSPSGRKVPSPREKARLEAWHRERQQEEEDERRRREEHELREHEALTKVRERFEENATVSILGLRVKPKDVHVS